MRERYGSGIRVPPPAIFIVAFLLGLWAEGALRRLRVLDGDGTPRPLLLIGAVLIVAGAAVAAWGVVTFRHHRVAVLPFYPARQLVQRGPYRFTRNPMYLGMTLAHIGASLALNALWPLILLPMALVFLYRTVIRQEEAHLTQAFPEEYAAYIARVRRWI